jgi:protein-ribulosamine 3-kinase
MFHNTVDWQTIAAHISDMTGQPFQVQTSYFINGGCINQAYRIEGSGQNYFVKLNLLQAKEIFAAEMAGLQELEQANILKVPTPLCWGVAGQYAYIVMEYLTLRRDIVSTNLPKLGQQLAQLHMITRPQFGWHQDNYLGSTPQINTLTDDWVYFWQHHRLRFQLELAANRGYGSQLQIQAEQLLSEIKHFFVDYQPPASLLHGDLWSGNYGITVESQGNQPVLFDPAVYYGDRETDIALTELFGGFPKSFYDAYQEQWPLDSGYSTRKTLYNLYHILNHLNLFGGAYLKQVEQTMAFLLSEVR